MVPHRDPARRSRAALCSECGTGDTDWTEFGLGAPGKFDMYRAIANWDEEHMAAFVSWLIAPFWP